VPHFISNVQSLGTRYVSSLSVLCICTKPRWYS